MFIALLYEIGLIILAVLAAPLFLYRRIFKKKYRNTIRKRFGVGFPQIKRDGRPVVWIHAVSLGETKAVTPLVKLIKTRFNNPLIIFSTTTETGHVEACRKVSADHHVYLPFDFSWVINPIMKQVSPDFLILCESDFWYNLLKSAKKNGAKVVLVNGKISVKSAKRFMMIPWFTKRLFACIDAFSVQSNLYKKRFEQLGVPAKKIVVTGNMKFDGDHPRLPDGQLKAWRHELGIKPSDQVLVIGSSHSPEEEQLLNIMSQVWKKIPNIKVVLVPRHPERFNEVAGILQKNHINFRRLSQKNSQESQVSVILVDAMGLLCKCYQLADVAIVAGSYGSKIGGHNILEPAWYGVPALFGPHMHTQPDLVDLAKEYGSGLQVDVEDLEKVLIQLFENPDKRKVIGDGGLRLAADVHGATEKTYALIEKMKASRQ
ncbi:MAG: 3-deoxy-D-manno-octulosonic acid transferase [Parachlamydiaceae bacterium]